MISRNLALQRDPGKETYYIRMSSLDKLELEALAEKHKGLVNVKISKPISSKTEAQMAAFHALLMSYWLTGMHSAPEWYRQNFDRFRLWFKLTYGVVYEAEYKGKTVVVAESMTKYTKNQLSTLIEAVLTEIGKSGAYASSAKLREIIQGMEANQK